MKTKITLQEDKDSSEFEDLIDILAEILVEEKKKEIQNK